MATKLPYAHGSYARQVAKSPTIPFKNRFVEQMPPLTDGEVVAIARPRLKYMTNYGTGPVRANFSAPGIFDNVLFSVSGEELYEIDAVTGAATLIGSLGTDILGDVSFAAVAQIEDTVPSRLFIADGGILWVYTKDSEAIGHLNATGAIASGDVVVIAGVYYKWTSGSVDTGTPAGTSGAPWLVALGASNADALKNMYYTINADEGTPGTDYSTLTTANPSVRATQYTSSDLYVAAQDPGTAGNVITTTETGANIAWGGGTLSGGGSPRLRQVTVPGDVGAVSICELNSFVFVVPVQSESLFTIGKFYWIEPGDTFIDPLNFANAERSSDTNQQILPYKDQFIIFGGNSTEAWVPTADPDAPFERYQGVFYARGSWNGGAIVAGDALVVIDPQGGVWLNSGGMKLISRPDIEERIRRAIQVEGLLS